MKATEITLAQFAQLCKSYGGTEDYNIVSAANLAIDYFGATKAGRNIIRPSIDLERRWYDSLAAGLPDFSVYDDPIMLSDTWACWRLYSRKYISLINKRLKDGTCLYDRITKMESICDLGCGPGLTTLELAEMFPSLKITGTQLASSAQFKVANHLASRFGFSIAEQAPTADFVFASEYFEHFERPVEHLRDILDATNCKLIMFANAFGALAVGHFNTYKDGVKTMNAKETGRAFNAELRKRGFCRVDTGFWNNRPNVFERGRAVV